jgi:hypothetical protein
MWQPNMVERGLFRWNKWRNSIIKNWVEWKHNQDVSTSLLELAVGQELNEMGLPTLSILEIYWISCITSDCNLDYPTTYTKIVTPVGLEIGGYEINPGIRVYPPPVIDDKDLKFESSQYGFIISELQSLYSESYSFKMLLQSDHELLDVLKGIRGRPGTRGKHGPLPRYHDRLAVQCAAFKDTGMSYVEIAERLHLPVTRPIFSRQSDVTVNLVRRGRKLLRELPS